MILVTVRALEAGGHGVLVGLEIRVFQKTGPPLISATDSGHNIKESKQWITYTVDRSLPQQGPFHVTKESWLSHTWDYSVKHCHKSNVQSQVVADLKSRDQAQS